MAKQTQMQHPYELFAYEVGQDMKALENRVVALENKPAPTMPKVEEPKTQPIAVFTATIQPTVRADDESKISSGEYTQDESHIRGTIQVAAKYAGYQFLMLDQVNGKQTPITGVVGANGVMGFYSQTTHARNVVLFLYQPERAESAIYFDVKEVSKIKGKVLASTPELIVTQSGGFIKSVVLKGIDSNREPIERYLEFYADQLKVTYFDNMGEAQTHEEVLFDTESEGYSSSFCEQFMSEIYELSSNSQSTPSGYQFGVSETKLRFNIRTKEGFVIEKEVINEQYYADHPGFIGQLL